MFWLERALLIFLLHTVLSHARVVDFGGAYITSEFKCTAENVWTGSCECPSSFTSACHLINQNKKESLCVCEPSKLSNGGTYGGSFSRSQVNTYTKNHSCESQYQPAQVSSDLFVCLNKNGAGNFHGAFLEGAYECPRTSFATTFKTESSSLVICQSSIHLSVDPNGLQGKVLFGYQGWFSTPADASRTNWRHWSPGVSPSGSTVSFDLWPDLTEFGADELYATSLHYPNGKTAGLYDSANPKTIDRHFNWMQTYGLDGVFLQRFVNEITNVQDPMFSHRNNVTSNIMKSSVKYGRTWAVMYDISGADPNQLYNILVRDWGYLTKSLGIANNAQYLKENGKPVLAIWGFGFTDRSFSQSLALQVINYFKSIGVYVIGGVPYWWRTSDHDSVANFLSVYEAFDLISPWAVGRYSDLNGIKNLYNQVVAADLTFVQSNKKGYAPVIFPGFSWSNLKHDQSVFNQIPRQNGVFFTAQAQNFIKKAGVTFIYIAMFDEVDEGTAMFKAAPQKADTPSDGKFLYLGVDGDSTIKSDHYLVLAGSVTSQNK